MVEFSPTVVDELLPLVRLEVVGLFPNWNRNKAALWLKLPVVVDAVFKQSVVGIFVQSHVKVSRNFVLDAPVTAAVAIPTGGQWLRMELLLFLIGWLVVWICNGGLERDGVGNHGVFQRFFVPIACRNPRGRSKRGQVLSQGF